MNEAITHAATEDLSALRAAFVDTAIRFAGKDVASRAVQLDVASLVAEEYVSLRAALFEAGLLGMLAPEDAGGMGMDAGSVGLVLARIAEACAGTAMLMWAHETSLLAMTAAMRRSGSDAPGMVISDGLLGNALVSRHALHARRQGDGWLVDGTAEFVWGAGVADRYVVAASTDSGGIVAVVDADQDGLTVREQHIRIGLRACPSAALGFAGVAARHALVLDSVSFVQVVAGARQQALALAGAIANGNARGAWRSALQYARERYQGGDIIIGHALVQGMLGKTLADIRAGEALVADGLERGGDDAVLAKVIASRHGEQACLDAMQVFGGYGYMRDYGIEKRLRDAKMLALVGGSNDRLLQGVVAAHRHEGDWS